MTDMGQFENEKKSITPCKYQRVIDGFNVKIENYNNVLKH